MPKMKTRRSAAKRVQVRKGGKLKCFHTGHKHLLGHKSSKRKRRLDGSTHVGPAMAAAMRRQLPYGS
jgi:large subunit ribosomal protein L35